LLFQPIDLQLMKGIGKTNLLFTRVFLMWGEKQPKNSRKCIASTTHQRVNCTLDKCTLSLSAQHFGLTKFPVVNY
ncbi:hypothetical protein T10_3816, partial [Trichinella papuae]